MIADGLTKIKGNNGPLYKLMQQGTFRIQAEDTQMAVRENARAQGQRVDQIRRTGVKENFGSCENTFHSNVQVDSSCP
jgi:hypothetical protein